MEKYFVDLLYKLENSIKDIETEAEYSILRIETIIDIILHHLAELKIYVLKNGFDNSEEEIHFFKYQKPQIVAKLIYYNAIYKIETKKPYGAKPIRSYLNNELKKLKRFFDNNLDFYKYYRTNNSYIDDKLFLRGKYDIKLSLDTFYFEADQCFSTSHDYKAAKIIANDQLQVYLEDQLHNSDFKNKSTDLPQLNWHASKTALTELIYALHAQNVFSNSDIKGIVKTFEIIFNIDLGDFYHTYMELKSRKINRTKFIDSLRKALENRMDEQDNI